MKCEHKGCKNEAEINICHEHINKDYPPDYNPLAKEIGKLLKKHRERIEYVVPEELGFGMGAKDINTAKYLIDDVNDILTELLKWGEWRDLPEKDYKRCDICGKWFLDIEKHRIKVHKVNVQKSLSTALHRRSKR